MSDHSQSSSCVLRHLRTGGLALALVIVSVGVAHPGSAREAEHGQASREVGVVSAAVATGVPTSVATPIARARLALTTAQGRVQKHQYTKAVASLRTVRLKVASAHTAGMAQIGKPPADPESDDPPGPPSVIAVLNMEHAVGNGVVAMFNGTTSRKAIRALRYTLRRTHLTRDTMLTKLVALPAEGARADYSDDMSDTAGLYRNEVKLVTAALKTYRLTGTGRVGLNNALARVKATRVLFNKGFGGDE